MAGFVIIQMNPADLNNRSFYSHRHDLFELRFKEMEESNLDDLLFEMEQVYNGHYGVSNSEIAWDCFTDFEQIKVKEYFSFQFFYLSHMTSGFRFFCVHFCSIF